LFFSGLGGGTGRISIKVDNMVPPAGNEFRREFFADMSFSLAPLVAVVEVERSFRNYAR
jgi:hypothetical protein